MRTAEDDGLDMAGALDGIRILELAGPRTQYGSMLLAGMGAEVWLVEPPSGSPLRRIAPFAATDATLSLPFLAFHSNKKSAALDLTGPEGREAFLKLANTFDVVLESETPGALDELGIGPKVCRSLNPALIWASVTAYGSDGPRAHYIGSDLSAQAMGGAMSSTGEPNGRVFKAGGDVGDKMAGYTAAAALLVALLDRDRTGRGQQIDVSAQEAVAGQMERGPLSYQYTHAEPERGGRLYPTAAFPCGLFPASDGWISLVALQPNHWEALVDWIGDPRLAVERFKVGSERAIARDEIDALICDWSRRHTKEELAIEGQRRRIAIAALQSASEVTRDEHLLAVDFFRKLEHPGLGAFTIPGPPFAASQSPFRVATVAPAIGQHTTELAALIDHTARRTSSPGHSVDADAAPLAGYRVLDLSWVIAGPACTRFLADQGAEVIKVESTRMGDPVRTFGPWLDGKSTAPEGGGAFMLLNRNKRSITLDLKKPEGVALLLELVKQSDVVVDNFTACTMDRLGLGYAVLAQANPAIVMAQLSGFGQSGPYAHRVAYGQTLLALTGHYNQIGEAHNTPIMPGYTYTDQAAGMIGAFAILAALRYRNRTGKGQHLDLSLFQMGSSLVAETLLETLVNDTEAPRAGNGNARAISHGVYRGLGRDSWCVIATWSIEQWGALVSEIGRDDPALATELKTASTPDDVDRLIEKWTVHRTPAEVMERLQGRRVEAAIVQSPRDLLESDPHLRERGFLQPITHGPTGRSLLTEGIPYALSRTARTIRRGPPRLGEANDYVLRKLLRLGNDDIAALNGANIVG